MVGYTVRPQAEADLLPHVSMYGVGEAPHRVGHNDQFIFIPLSAADFGYYEKDDIVVARAAFTVERPILGQKSPMVVPDGRLGQIALLSTARDPSDSLTAAIRVPLKPGLFSWRVRETQATDVVDSREADEILNDPTANFRHTVRRAIFRLINSETADLK